MELPRNSELLRQAKVALERAIAGYGIGIELRQEHQPPGIPEKPTADLHASLQIDGRELELNIELKNRLTSEVIDKLAARVAANSSKTWMLFAPYIQPANQRRLRERRMNFADLRGTLFLHAPGIRIDVVGREPAPSRVLPSALQAVNPFSKKASRVLRVLWRAGRRPVRMQELEDSASVSPSWCYKIVDELRARGYAKETYEGVALANPVAILRDWCGVYDWSRNTHQSYALPFSADEVLPSLEQAFARYSIEWALTLTSGARHRVGYVSGIEGHHVYALASDPADLVRALADVFAEPVQAGGNLTLLAPPYYGSAVFIGAERVEKVPLVSDLQMFLDLTKYPVRGPETASVLLQQRIAPALQMPESEVRTLVRDLQ